MVLLTYLLSKTEVLLTYTAGAVGSSCGSVAISKRKIKKLIRIELKINKYTMTCKNIVSNITSFINAGTTKVTTLTSR